MIRLLAVGLLAAILAVAGGCAGPGPAREAGAADESALVLLSMGGEEPGAVSLPGSTAAEEVEPDSPGAEAVTVEAGAPPAADVNGYRILPGDTIAVDVFREPDLAGEFRVSADGTITYPLLGAVEVSGLTVRECQARLVDLLKRDYLVNPRVAVAVRKSAARRVVVLGAVRTPGVYEIAPGESFTLLQAIAKAGGFSDVAAIDRVRIVRVENDAEQAIRVRVSEILKGRAGARDVDLRPNDVITVPETVF